MNVKIQAIEGFFLSFYVFKQNIITKGVVLYYIMLQKDIVHVGVKETTKGIINDLRDNLFGILDDEFRIVSCKSKWL